MNQQSDQYIDVKVPVSRRHGCWLPDRDGPESIEAVFRPMLHLDHAVLSSMSRETVGEGPAAVQDVDRCRMRALMLRRLLVSWTIDIELVHDGCWLAESTFNRIKRLPAPLVEALLDQYEQQIYPTQQQDDDLAKQAIVLFSPNSGGVMNPCEAISLYCTLSDFWDKFGLNRFELEKLPFREFAMLREMLSREKESTRRQHQQAGHQSKSRMVGPGGRIVPSRGVVVG